MFDPSDVVGHVRDGMLPAHIYNDSEIFAAERETVFARSWVFLAHESEIPQAGDYVVRRVMENSFIVSRAADGTVHAMFNMCLHRGCRCAGPSRATPRTSAAPTTGGPTAMTAGSWACPSTGRRTAARLPASGAAAPPRTGDGHRQRPDLRLLDPAAPPLREYLGDFAFYLDYYTRQSPSGVEVRGPQRWRIKANWKIGAENFAGDMYHTPQTHASVVEIGLFREPKAEKRKDGTTYWATGGGGTTYKLPPGTLEERLRYVGYPDEMIDRMKRVWSAEQLDLIGRDGFMVSAASIVPNLSLVHNWPRVADSDDVLPSCRCASGSRSVRTRPRCSPGSWSTRRPRRTSRHCPTRPT